MEFAQWAAHAPPSTVSSQPLWVENHVSLPVIPQIHNPSLLRPSHWNQEKHSSDTKKRERNNFTHFLCFAQCQEPFLGLRSLFSTAKNCWEGSWNCLTCANHSTSTHTQHSLEEANISQGCVLAHWFHYLQHITRCFVFMCCASALCGYSEWSIFKIFKS